MKKIITTVGTSIFENNDLDFSQIKGQSLLEYENHIDEIEEIKKEIENFDSAEITVAEKYKNEEIVLIASDTLESIVAAEIIKDFLEKKKIKVSFVRKYNENVAGNLRFDSNLENGIQNLIEIILNIHKVNGKYDFANSIFNITGGYKPLISYLSLIAQIVGASIVYALEDNNEIFEIPKYPIGFDDKIADLYLPYLNNLVLQHIFDSKVLKELEELKFIKYENNKYQLTQLGIFFKNFMNHKSSYFGDLIEYLLFSYFMNKYGKIYNIEQSKKYSINGENGDFDLYLENDKEVEIKEVKSIGQIKKFIDKQVEKYKEWLITNKQSKKKTITLLVYLVEPNILEIYKEQFKRLKEDLKQQDINFNIEYLEIPLKNFNSFIKEFSKLKLERIDDV